jgi:hypothetical protein
MKRYHVMREIFIRDFEKVLKSLDKLSLCRNHENFIDYVRSYKYFLETWIPKAEEKPK